MADMKYFYHSVLLESGNSTGYLYLSKEMDLSIESVLALSAVVTAYLGIGLMPRT